MSYNSNIGKFFKCKKGQICIVNNVLVEGSCHTGDKDREIVMDSYPEEEGQRSVDIDSVYHSLPDYGPSVLGHEEAWELKIKLWSECVGSEA